MKKAEIVFVFVEDYLDWESALPLNFIRQLGQDKYIIRIAGMTKESICALSGVRILPDYSLEDCPRDFAGLILIGGVGWMNHLPERISILQPVIAAAINKDCPIAAIGTGVGILGAYGLLNHIAHTGNSPAEIRMFSELSNSSDPYTGDAFYRNVGAVKNKNIITGKNISGLAVARAFIKTLNIDQKKADLLYYKRLSGAFLPVINVNREKDEPMIL